MTFRKTKSCIFLGVVALATAAALASTACDPTCETLLNCGPYPEATSGAGVGVGGGAVGGSVGATTTAVGGMGGAGGSGPTAAGGSMPMGVAQLAVGASHVCARMLDGTVRCWGDGSEGALGLGDPSSTPVPVEVPALTGVTDLASGAGHTCAVVAGGVQCWGRNDGFQIDASGQDVLSPLSIAGLDNVVEVAAGSKHTCARLSTGGVACLGTNFYGQLGDGSNNDSTSPVDALNIIAAVEISIGNVHSCAVHDGDLIGCWGNNFSGQLGQTGGSKTTIATLPGENAVDVSTSWDHTCIVDELARAVCWGDNLYGQIGDGTSMNTYDAPVIVPALPGVVDVCAGAHHTCAVLDTGAVHCWGGGTFGQLGHGVPQESSVPVKVSGLTTAVAVECGGATSCAVLDDFTVRCWGAHVGKDVAQSSTPVRPVGL